MFNIVLYCFVYSGLLCFGFATDMLMYLIVPHMMLTIIMHQTEAGIVYVLVWIMLVVLRLLCLECSS